MGFHEEVANDQLTYRVIGLAYEVHNELGSDLPEHIYRDAMSLAAGKANLQCLAEHEIPVIFNGEQLGERYVDLLVDQELVVELKAVKKLCPKHFEQLGTNVRAAKVRRGLLLNFGAPRVQVQRYINPAYAPVE